MVIILLLIGGIYFFLTGNTRSNEKSLPSLRLSPSLQVTGDGVLLVVRGEVVLPAGEYNVEEVVIEGPSYREAFGPSVVKGPSTFPFSSDIIKGSWGDGEVYTVRARVREGENVYLLEGSIPVVYPKKEAVYPPPVIAVNTKDVNYVSGEVIVVFHINNTTAFPYSYTLTVGSTKRSGTIDPYGEAVEEIDVLPDISSWKLDYTVKGYSGSLEGDLNVYTPPSPEPVLVVKVGYTSDYTPSGMEINVKGEVWVEGVKGRELDLKAVVRKGDVKKEVSLLKTRLEPGVKKTFSKRVEVEQFLLGGVIEVLDGNRVIMEIPLEPSFLPFDPPSVSLLLDSNTGKVTITLESEQNVEIRNFDVKIFLDGASSPVYDMENTNFYLSGTKVVDINNGMAYWGTTETKYVITFEYGGLGVYEREEKVFTLRYNPSSP